MAGRKIAVVLLNMGGPDGLKAVRPFLFNLFNDAAMINRPALVRTPLAWLISTLRSKSAQANYAIMGGASPQGPETRKQAAALNAVLTDRLKDDDVQVFIAMRYWKPFTDETAKAVAAYGPDEIVLLPLYPQFSTTTTRSSLTAWKAVYGGPGRVRDVCCYPVQANFIAAHADKIAAALKAAGPSVRLLFSAHGLPESIIDSGDPYRKQIEATAAAIAARLGGDLDWRICYQSRVGPMKWIGPSTMQAIEAAAHEGLGVVISPIAFVSEHIETLVELDHEYAELADRLGCPVYVRVAALGDDPGFMEGLAQLALGALNRHGGAAPGPGWTPTVCGPICGARESAS